ncbi:MAG: ATP-binding protein, partial [Candidatus Brocadiales bacterium]
PVRGRDEIAVLAQGFNSMAETIEGDIEIIKAQVKEIQESRNFLSDVLGNIGFFLRVVNPKTHKVFLQNRPLQALFPHGLERPCYALWGGRETACDLCVSMKAIEENRYCFKEEETPEGIVYEIHAFPFAEPDGTVTKAIEVIRDITARRKVERDLEDSRMQLMQSQKMAAIGHLSSGIAHSINNPLSGINMYVDVLLKKIEEVKDCVAYPDLKNHLMEVKEAAKRCNAVVKDLLSIARIPKPERLPVYINETVERVLSVVSPQMKLMRIQLVRELSPTAPRVLGSQGQLETVFMNIISNAIDAMPGGGTLTIRTGHLAREGKVEIAIQDTGCGINKKDIPYIFNPYFTTKPAGKGTVLGLSIAQLTILSHRGTIDVDSEVGRGTTFKIKLPVYRENLPLER